MSEASVAETQRSFLRERLPAARESPRGGRAARARGAEGAGGALKMPFRSERLVRFGAAAGERRGEDETGSVPGSRAEGQRGQLLVVEDNRDTLHLLSYVLRADWDITEATRPQEALEMALSGSFDVLLVDINLGGETDGVDLLHALREHDAYRDVPALALTAYAMPDDRERFINAGFDEYLSKPFVADELRRLLRRLQ